MYRNKEIDTKVHAWETAIFVLTSVGTVILLGVIGLQLG